MIQKTRFPMMQVLLVFPVLILLTGFMLSQVDPYSVNSMRIVQARQATTVDSNVTFIGQLNTDGYTYGVAVSGNYAYVADGFSGLRVVDISNPAVPFQVALLNTGGDAFGVVVHDTLVYVSADQAGVRIISISDPLNPYEVGFLNTGGNTRAIALSDTLAYVADGDSGLQVINIADPANPAETGSFITDEFAWDVALKGQNIFMANWIDGIRSFDVSDPTDPQLTGFTNNNIGQNLGIAIVGDLALLAAGPAGLRVIDIFFSFSPQEIGDFDTNGNANDVAISGRHVYVADGNEGLRMINFDDPALPLEVGFYDTGGNARGVTADGARLYVADGTDGLYILNDDLTLEQELSGGWQLVGLPRDVFVSEYLELYPGAIQTPLAWNAANGVYEGDFFLDVGKGYWVILDAAETAVVQGDPIDSLTIDLENGWNLISGISDDIAFNQIADPDSILTNQLITFDPLSGVYANSDTVVAGVGYWLLTTGSGQITLKSGVAPKQPILASRPIKSDLTRQPFLKISDNKGRSQTLYLDVELADIADRTAYALPPLPPEGVFDVRFEDHSSISDKLNATIEIQGRDFPLTVTAGNLSEAAADLYVIDQFAGGKRLASYDIDKQRTISLHNIATDRLMLRKGSGNPESDDLLPLNFHVAQNYPNPFNPTTTIRYQLPHEAEVRVTIYSLLGQKVRTLIAERRDAGTHHVVWDAKNDNGIMVSSGIYYYEVIIGERRFWRKMVLLK